jgi:hypothetical protein
MFLGCPVNTTIQGIVVTSLDTRLETELGSDNNENHELADPVSGRDVGIF